MIVHTSEHYPHFGVCVLSHMCPNLIDHMVPEQFSLYHSSLGHQLRCISQKNWQK